MNFTPMEFFQKDVMNHPYLSYQRWLIHKIQGIFDQSHLLVAYIRSWRKYLLESFQLVLQCVIDLKQSVFLSARNILHSVLATSEAIDEARRRKKKCLFFKVDYEKAFDLVSWNFLLCMLGRLGFGRKWIGWIKKCLVPTHISILVNKINSHLNRV